MQTTPSLHCTAEPEEKTLVVLDNMGTVNPYRRKPNPDELKVIVADLNYFVKEIKRIIPNASIIVATGDTNADELALNYKDAPSLEGVLDVFKQQFYPIAELATLEKLTREHEQSNLVVCDDDLDAGIMKKWTFAFLYPEVTDTTLRAHRNPKGVVHITGKLSDHLNDIMAAHALKVRVCPLAPDIAPLEESPSGMEAMSLGL